MADVNLSVGSSNVLKRYSGYHPGQYINFYCSYNSSGVLTVRLNLSLTGSWTWNSSNSAAWINFNSSSVGTKWTGASKQLSAGNHDLMSKTGTYTAAQTITVYAKVAVNSGTYGPTGDYGGAYSDTWWDPSNPPSDAKTKGGGRCFKFTVYIPGIITAPSTPSFKSIGTAYGNLSGGQGDVSVSWNASSAGTGNTVRDYTIQACYPGESWYDKWTGTGTSTTLNFNGTAGSNCAISLRIRANGNAGVNSGWSATGTAMVYTIFAPGNVRYYAIEHDPNTIRGTQASGIGGGSVAQKIRLSWNASSGATGYRVRLMWRNTANTAWEEYSSNYYSTSSNYLDITLPPKSSYPGSRRNDLWINVQAYKSTPNRVTYYTSWVGPYYGFRRSATTKIYINNSWKNGSIWIFNGTKWCPASDIHIYNSEWKKSKLF